MTEYQRPSFTVKTGGRRPEECGHGWVNPEKGRCVLCAAQVAEPQPLPPKPAPVAIPMLKFPETPEEWTAYEERWNEHRRFYEARDRRIDEAAAMLRDILATPTEETPDDE